MEQIVIKNYNLSEIEKIVITHCIENNKDKTLAQKAKLLNISERTLHRAIQKYKIPFRGLRGQMSRETFIEKLKEEGYIIKAPKIKQK